MGKLKPKKWDVVEHLDTDEDMALYLEAAFEEAGDDPAFITKVLGDIAETRDLDENTLLDVDASGNIVAMTIEHARQRADIPHFSFEQIAA